MRDRDLAGRGDRFIAEGRVVLQALMDAEAGHGRFVLEKALILENRVEGIEDLLARMEDACPVYVAGPRCSMLRSALPCIAAFSPWAHLPAGSLAEFLAGMPEKALLVVPCGIANQRQYRPESSAIAGVFGADGVVLDATCCDPLYRKAIRVSVGGRAEGSVLPRWFHRRAVADACVRRLRDRRPVAPGASNSSPVSSQVGAWRCWRVPKARGCLRIFSNP